MAKAVWDQTGERWYELGVEHGMLYTMKDPSEFTDEDNRYNTGVPWNGLTSVDESPDGAEPNDLWADNIKYASIMSAETFGGTINAYTYPDEFSECNGMKEAADGLFLGQQPRRQFGFVYVTKVGNDTMTETDDYDKIHIVYNATASPSDITYETINDSPDAIEMSWEFTTTPIKCTGAKPLSTMVVNRKKASPTRLSTLEGMLFGTENSDPTLPSPDTIVKILNGTYTAPGESTTEPTEPTTEPTNP